MYKNNRRYYRNPRGPLICQNCGEKGHHFKECRAPKSSLGIICYQKNRDNLKYLMICRRNTIGYVQFIRGQYINSDISYIQKLFDVMTDQEISYIKEKDFDFLWEYLWLDNFYNKVTDKIRKDKDHAHTKFNYLKTGFNEDNKLINIQYFIDNKKEYYNVPEWGFPKGRRNNNESNFTAAKREFCEETGINEHDIFLSTSSPTFIEEYKSYDNITYRNTYYLAEFLGDSDKINIESSNKEQYTEVSDLGFYDYNKCLDMIRNYSDKKKIVLSEVNSFLTDRISFSNTNYDFLNNMGLTSYEEWDGFPKSI
jgi:8-oxo-dGTP pyrophosphatase MutT (NUDIX family)